MNRSTTSSRQRVTTRSSRLARLARLRRMRGAAMVEAAVVLPVLTIFFGVMMFARAQYSAKLYSMSDARQNAWDRAVHAECGGGSGGGTAPSLDVPDPPNDTNSKVLQPGPSVGAKKQGMDKILRKVEWSKNTTTTVSKYSGTTSSRSFVFCNEANYAEGSVLGKLGEFVTFVKSFWEGGLL